MQETHRPELAPARGVEAPRREFFRGGGALSNGMIKRGLMMAEGQRSIAPGPAKCWDADDGFPGTPTVGEIVHRYLDHLDTGIVYPSPAFIVQRCG